MPLEILPFAVEHLDAAAALLAGAHARHRAAEPLLGRVDDYRGQVAREWEREGSSGAIVVDPAARRSGAGLALTAFVLAWAHEHGFRSLTTDWRSVNLLSSRFWPKRGWRPTYLRLDRAVP